ncbi:hypothetical protein [Kerstersia gyiorum]|uniref:hypothetical protein n=1 Tax=Kerstersia gyiorum TaxID=206506 RepID=UPI0030CA809E
MKSDISDIDCDISEWNNGFNTKQQEKAQQKPGSGPVPVIFLLMPRPYSAVTRFLF